MAMDEWETLADGSLKLFPMMDARVAKSPLQVFLRLQYAHLPEGRKTPALEHLQLGMTPAQARQLHAAISEALDRIEREQQGMVLAETEALFPKATPRP